MNDRPAVRRRRGEPLAALVLLIAGWTGARMALWDPPFAVEAEEVPATTFAPLARTSARKVAAEMSAPPRLSPVQEKASPDRFEAPAYAHPSLKDAVPVVAYSSNVRPVAPLVLPPMREALAGASPVIPPAIIATPVLAPVRGGGRRWHLSAWAAWREGSGLPRVANGARPASYGGSQAGAVAQLDLGSSTNRPALHLRTTYAPDRPRQAEIAAGASLRPLSTVPVRLLGEVRARHSEGRTEVRPALLAVTEMAPLPLPLGLVAEGYAQGGWVGGRYATAFADGQARITRSVGGLAGAQVRLGAGAWGGAQKFVERVDVGPTASVELAPVHLSLDYRIKVAGNATPGNGVAVTLSTGF